MKTVFVLLTKYSDWISNLVYHIGGQGYTHASVSMEEDKNRFYSFNYHGFCVETIEKHRHRGVKNSLCYQMTVSDASYDRMRECIGLFEENKEIFRYTRMGVVLCILGIPFKWRQHYFCSQFVAELLEVSGALALKKSPSLYLPNHFCRELEQHSQLLGVQCNVI